MNHQLVDAGILNLILVEPINDAPLYFTVDPISFFWCGVVVELSSLVEAVSVFVGLGFQHAPLLGSKEDVFITLFLLEL